MHYMQLYFQSQMISKEDYDFITAFDSSDARENKLKQNSHQAVKTFLNLEDRSRVEIFREHSTRKSVWGPFLNLLNMQDGFIMNVTSRIIAKLACWSRDLMEETDLQFYLTWLKDQLKLSTHLPGYIQKANDLKSQGVSEIFCVSVNDPFVMAAWGKEHNATGKVRMLADPKAEFTDAIDLGIDLQPLGGKRSKRYSMVIENGKIKELNVEPDNTGLSCSLADHIKV